MDLFVRYRTGLRDKLTGVTGNPTEIAVTILNGYYRDIFTIESNVTGITFPGTEEATPKDASLPLPAAIFGRIVPTGDVTIERLENDTESSISVATFQIATSDEIAHAPLRQVQYQESYWAFPVNHDGISMNCMFRKAVVDGWSNADDDD